MDEAGETINYYHEVTITAGFVERAFEVHIYVGETLCERGRTGLKGVVLCRNTLDLAHCWHVLVKLAMSFLMPVHTNLSPMSLTPVLIPGCEKE